MIQSNLLLSEVYDFLGSVTIKNVYFAEAAAAKAMAALFVEELDDTENPYYQNLVGDYSMFDEIMTITSIDTETEIEFTKANLELHPKTKQAYQIPSDQYEQLVSRYPSQGDLIKSILYPVTDINEAIAAENFALLQYNEELLEYQEVASIVNAITKQLKQYRVRWDVREFTSIDYFAITQWAGIWATLPTVILAQRIANLKTSNAHSTHIWEYLTSNGLGDYRSILNREQELFLYKNIQYIIQNRGKDRTLTILAENLLKPHNVTLKSKSILLNTEDSGPVAHPTAEVISRDIRDVNTPTQAAANSFETVDGLFKRAYDNGLEPVYNEAVVAEQEKTLAHAKQSWIPTKLVELNKVDLYTGQHSHYIRFAIETILLRQSMGSLDYNITVPFTDTDISINLTPGECLALIFYCIAKEFNDEALVDIPATAYVDIPFKDTFPTLEYEFKYRGVTYGINHIMDAAGKVARIPSNVGNISSPTGLLGLIDEQFKYMWLDHQVCWSNQDMSYHLAFDLLYAQLRHHEQIPLNWDIGYSTYAEWFASNSAIGNLIESLEGSVRPKEAFARAGNDTILALAPLNDSTQTTFTNFTSSDYELMKQLFIQLCSYTIAFLDTDRKSNTFIRFTPIVVNDLSQRDYTGVIEIDRDDFQPSFEQHVVQRSVIEMHLGLDSTQHTEHVTDLTRNIEATHEHHVVNDVTNMVLITEETESLDIAY